MALINPLIHLKGYAAPETKAAAERARSSSNKSEAVGEPPEDPLLLFTVLFGHWVPNYVCLQWGRDAGARDPIFGPRSRAGTSTAPLMIGHRVMGLFLMTTGDMCEGRPHYNQAIALYDPVEHRRLATRFGVDVRVAILTYRPGSCGALAIPRPHSQTLMRH